MKTDQLVHTLAQDLATPPATVQATLRYSMPIAAAVLLVGWLAAAGVRADVLSTGLRPTLIKLGLGGLLTVVGLVGVLQLSRPDARWVQSARWLAVIPTFALLAAGAEWLSLGADGWQMRLLGKGQMVCLVVVPLLAVVPLIGVLAALRRGAPTRPNTVGALAGVAAAGIAIVAYGLFCTENSAFYIGAWYLLASCISGFIGALAGRFALRW
jgi:hypothetical protein